jgi:hypothetical protein
MGALSAVIVRRFSSIQRFSSSAQPRPIMSHVLWKLWALVSPRKSVPEESLHGAQKSGSITYHKVVLQLLLALNATVHTMAPSCQCQYPYSAVCQTINMWNLLTTPAQTDSKQPLKFTFRHDLVEDLQRLEIVMKTVEFDAKRTLTDFRVRLLCYFTPDSFVFIHHSAQWFV